MDDERAGEAMMGWRTYRLAVVVMAGGVVACGETAHRAAADDTASVVNASRDSVVIAEPAPTAVAPVVEKRGQQPPPARSPASRAKTTTAPVEPIPAKGSAPDPAVQGGPRTVMVGTLDLTGVGYDIGNARAPVVVVEFSDFGCPYCADFALQTYPTLEREYIRTGKVFFKYVPFVAGTFRHAAEATRAAECVGDQGQFWLMMTRLYETQPGWKMRGSPDALLGTVARSTRVDSAQFAACYSDRRTEPRTQAATTLADRAGVWMTPSFVVNGKPVQGALPLPEFRKVLNEAVASARKK